MEQTKRPIAKHELIQLFGKVKQGFTYVCDVEKYGILEKWVLPDDDYDGTQSFSGDCEDFALALRKLIHDQGHSSRLIICHTEEKELHCVVATETDKGTYILDNRFNSIKTKSELTDLGYSWVKMSDTSYDQCKWFEVL
jgi:predicted transglutaminase-like cysteine proteinase